MASSMWSFLLPVAFVIISIPVFIKVLIASKMVIDEEFHVRQGVSFCNREFNVWDSKITTFPGLYFLAVLLGPLGMCNVLGMRIISLTAASINVLLFYKIRRFNTNSPHGFDSALDAFTLAMLPPMYFFSHVYYTDVVALTFLLLFYYFWLKDERLCAAVFACASVLVRQTSIVWISMSFGITALNALSLHYAKKKSIRTSKVNILNWRTFLEILSSFDVIWKSFCYAMMRVGLLLVIIVPFIAFVILNGSLVVGDKKAHQATLHLPQLFYFCLFTAFFAVVNSLQNIKTTVRLIRREKLIFLFFLGISILVVKWNTLAHPYLLADNRHYAFYIWNRFYGHYSWFRYAMTPVYLIGLTTMVQGLRSNTQGFKIMFWVSTILVLCCQRLLEVRYFLTPFVIFRLHMERTPRAKSLLWVELICYLALNVATFYIFFTKEIEWTDYREPQRIIW